MQLSMVANSPTPRPTSPTPTTIQNILFFNNSHFPVAWSSSSPFFFFFFRFASSQAANQAGCQQMWQALYAGLQHIERMCFTSKEFGQLLLQQNRTYFVPLMTNHTPALLCHSLDIAIAWCSSCKTVLSRFCQWPSCTTHVFKL